MSIIYQVPLHVKVGKKENLHISRGFAGRICLAPKKTLPTENHEKDLKELLEKFGK